MPNNPSSHLPKRISADEKQDGETRRVIIFRLAGGLGSIVPNSRGGKKSKTKKLTQNKTIWKEKRHLLRPNKPFAKTTVRFNLFFFIYIYINGRLNHGASYQTRIKKTLAFGQLSFMLRAGFGRFFEFFLRPEREDKKGTRIARLHSKRVCAVALKHKLPMCVGLVPQSAWLAKPRLLFTDRNSILYTCVSVQLRSQNSGFYKRKTCLKKKIKKVFIPLNKKTKHEHQNISGRFLLCKPGHLERSVVLILTLRGCETVTFIVVQAK
ncbi:hypothetical protein E2320_012472 [Naja naja]|nr:hypothetical protein E2320_012472 [Naja naja]